MNICHVTCGDLEECKKPSRHEKKAFTVASKIRVLIIFFLYSVLLINCVQSKIYGAISCILML